MNRRIDLLPILALTAGICAFVAACVVTHPIGITISDEVHYFTEAFAIRHGWPLANAGSYLLANGEIPFRGPRYPIGWPLLLAPFAAMPWPWVFALNPAIHLLGATVMALVFRRRGLSPAWALLYLAQPTLLAFSRTLMAEPLAGLQTALLLLVVDFDNPLLVGLVAGFAPLIKLSQVLVAGPFVAVWLWRRSPRSLRAILETALGSAIGGIGYLWFSHNAYGHWLAAEGTPTYATPLQVIPFLGLGLAQLSVAWPFLPLGLRRSRAPEVVTILCVFLYLALYGYHYRGPNLAATLIVGARLQEPAIILLLPGYAAWLASLGRPIRSSALIALLAISVVGPFVILSAVSARRSSLEELRTEVLQRLRPKCIAGYSQNALKLLLPLPPGKKLHGPQDVGVLDSDLARGTCVDLIDPLSEPSTYQNPPSYPDDFEPIVQSWPHRDMSGPSGVTVLWLDPR